LSPFEARWFSEQIAALREPVVFDDSSKNTIFRFTWLRTFHHPIAIRLEKQKDNYMLYWKVCSGAGGYSPGELIRDRHKKIDKATWNEFLNKLKEADFENMKTNIDVMGNDGSQWILEEKSGEYYHLVHRWTPDSSSTYYKCCDFLIGLTNLKIKARDKY
ncbi:MAG: hypothetical protein JST32_06545, partial [Bacteroidetes bacterium]|nr:hypothetical protein [Bacteroidota bacterium]